MCFPGAEIPEWFNFKNDGSSINMKLEGDWYNANFIGFALCVIFTNEVQGHLECTMSFRDKLDEKKSLSYKFPLFITDKEGAINEHVVMQSVHVDGRDVSSAVEVMFDFYYHKYEYDEDEVEYDFEYDEVVRCGIRMLYLQDAMDFFNSNRQYIPGESDDKPEPSKRPAIDFDTDKPHQKKTKFF